MTALSHDLDLQTRRKHSSSLGAVPIRRLAIREAALSLWRIRLIRMNVCSQAGSWRQVPSGLPTLEITGFLLLAQTESALDLQSRYRQPPIKTSRCSESGCEGQFVF